MHSVVLQLPCYSPLERTAVTQVAGVPAAYDSPKVWEWVRFLRYLPIYGGIRITVVPWPVKPTERGQHPHVTPISSHD